MYAGSCFFFIHVETVNKNGCNMKFNFVVLKTINNTNIACSKTFMTSFTDSVLRSNCRLLHLFTRLIILMLMKVQLKYLQELR